GVCHGALDLDCVRLTNDGVVKVLGLFCASPTPLVEVRADRGCDDDVHAFGALLFALLTGAGTRAVVVRRRAGGTVTTRGEVLPPAFVGALDAAPEPL